LPYTSYPVRLTGSVTGQTDWYVGNTITVQYTYATNNTVTPMTHRWDNFWQTSVTSSSYTISSITWEAWTAQHEETRAEREERQRQHARYLAQQGQHVPVALRGLLTEDELRAWEDLRQRRAEERLERERQAAMREEERQAAEVRAQALLHSILTAAQKREWLEHRRLTVTAPSGRVYRLLPGWSGNVCIMDGDVRRATLCVHPRERVPDSDCIAAQMLTILHDEERLLQLAILHAGQFSEDELEIRRRRDTVRVHAPDLGGGIAVFAEGA
jgi:hypothetical protein